MHIDTYVFIPIDIIYIFPSYSHSPFTTYQAIISPSSTISSDPQCTSIILLLSSRHTCPSTYTMSATFCCSGLNSIQVLMSLLWLYLANSFLAFSYSALMASTSYGIVVICLGYSCDCKVWAVGLDHNESPMGLWGCNKGVRNCLYVCAQRAKEQRCGASANVSTVYSLIKS